MSGDRRTREHDDSCNCVGCQVSRPYIRDGEQPAAPTRRSSLSRVRANAAYVAARASRDAWVGDKDLPALDADPDTPTACETCGDAGWFTADPSDPEFCECEAGKRLMAANNADPDTPTACICDGGAYMVKDHPFLVHPDCPVHSPDTPTTCQVDGCPPCHDRSCGNTPAGGAFPPSETPSALSASTTSAEGRPTAPPAGSPTADAPAHPDFSPENMARLREKALQNYIDTADAPADTDLLQAFSDAVLDALCDSPVWENRHIGELEVQICDDIAANALLPLVRAQVEAARRDAWDEGFRHARDGKDDGVGLLSDNPYRNRAARGETRQP